MGGTLTAIGLAHNAAIGDRSIKSATFLNTLTDFSVPGALSVFTDEATKAGLEKQMREAAYTLGVPKWLTFVKVVLPTALSGIINGILTLQPDPGRGRARSPHRSPPPYSSSQRLPPWRR